GAGGSCTMIVTFAPTATGPSTGTLSLGYNDGAANQTATRPLAGAGTPPALLTISDGPTYGFGTRATGSTTTHTFTVTNGGGVTATGISAGALAAPLSYSGGAFPGGGTCGTSLAAGATCTFVVAFAPTATGPVSATVTV